MGVMEIVLLVAGGIIAVLSFMLPAKQEEIPEGTRELAKEEIKTLVDKEMGDIRSHVDDVVDEAVGYAVEKTERSLERLTNEKIMAVNEYSDTVLKEIRKNHEETMFLYDMLNDKHKNLKNTVSEVNRTVQEVAETKKEAEAIVSSFQQLMPETVAQEERVVRTPGVPSVPVVSPASRVPSVSLESSVPSVSSVSLGSSVPSVSSVPLGSSVSSVPEASKTVRSFQAPKVSLAQTRQVPPASVGDDRGQIVNNNERIFELHRQGKSKIAIAKELGLGVGEVKLVIDLYKNM